MSKPANTAVVVDDDVEEPDVFGPDLLSDPTFVPCRHENCRRRELHREHEVFLQLGRKIHFGYDKCPHCQTALVVTKAKRVRVGKQTREITRADCPQCGWTHSKALKTTKGT